MANVNDPYMIGVSTFRKLQANQPVTINEYAVFLAVKEIQKRLNAILGANLAVDGMLGPKTDAVIKQLQVKLGVIADGMIGPKTAAALFMDIVKKEAGNAGVDWSVVAGLIKQESQFDPGAVGFIDTHDFGLGQINHTSHPELTIEQCFDHVFAIDYMVDRFKSALVYFSGNLRDAVASYNLGYGGTKEWIRNGRPDVWTPSWDTIPRDTKTYIDNILNAF
jgi:peptidoglycan hydrolase-like protein with peptidoglycan-binding domain